jgi:hypothetical protein
MEEGFSFFHAHSFLWPNSNIPGYGQPDFLLYAQNGPEYAAIASKSICFSNRCFLRSVFPVIGVKKKQPRASLAAAGKI